MATDNPKRHSRAYVEEEILLRSDEAQHVAKRAGPQAIVSLQKLAVVLGYLTKDKHIREVEGMIDQAIEKAAQEIAAEIARVQKLINDNGITVALQFNHPAAFTVALTTPAAVAYYGLIRQLDELMVRVHQLWFGRVWDSHQRREAGIQWQRRLVRLANRINHTEQRAWIAFLNKGKSDEPQNDSVTDTPAEPMAECVPVAPPDTVSASDALNEPTAIPAPAASDIGIADPTPSTRQAARPTKSVSL